MIQINLNRSKMLETDCCQKKRTYLLVHTTLYTKGVFGWEV